MSGSAALEYGFPSTHSTNAVSVTVYAIHMLQATADTANPKMHLALQGLFYFYAVSIVFGRLYCGMHGFFDVIIGSLLGWGLAVVQLTYGEWFDHWVCSNISNTLVVSLIVLALVRINPEPADDCPCFDDSVSFAGVYIGCQVGALNYHQSGLSWDTPIPSTVPFDFEKIGLIRAILRVVLGILIVFAWRGAMKPTLLRILPPFFRLLEKAKMNLPRAFFLEAS
jgi:hypothetical protein